jgi:hypothetical protein
MAPPPLESHAGCGYSRRKRGEISAIKPEGVGKKIGDAYTLAFRFSILG